MDQKARTDATSSTATTVTILPSRTVSREWTLVPGARSTDHQRERARKEAEAAVYSHLRAIRALGRTQINSLDVARALGLPVADVEEAIRNLSDKGVKVVG